MDLKSSKRKWHHTSLWEENYFSIDKAWIANSKQRPRFLQFNIVLNEEVQKNQNSSCNCKWIFWIPSFIQAFKVPKSCKSMHNCIWVTNIIFVFPGGKIFMSIGIDPKFTNSEVSRYLRILQKAFKSLNSRRSGALALKLPKTTWLFDCGEDTQRQVHKQPMIKNGKVDRMFITNKRSSNILGLPGMRHLMKISYKFTFLQCLWQLPMSNLKLAFNPIML